MSTKKNRQSILVITDKVGNDLTNGAQVFADALLKRFAPWFDITVISEDKPDFVYDAKYSLVYNLGATNFSSRATLSVLQHLPYLPVINHFQVILQAYAHYEGWTDAQAAELGDAQRIVSQLAACNIFPSFAEWRIAGALGWRMEQAMNYVVPNAFVPAGKTGRISKNDAVTFLAAGRFSDYVKGADLLYTAFKGVLKMHPDARLLVAGNDKRFIELLKKVPGESYKFMGWLTRAELFSAMRSADAVIVPSRYEPFGLVAVEAMAMGTPVIAMRTGGLAEIVRHEETGWLTPAGEGSMGLKTAMEAVADDRKLAAQFGANAKHLAKQEYSLERITGIIRNHINNTIETSGISRMQGPVKAPQRKKKTSLRYENAAI